MRIDTVFHALARLVLGLTFDSNKRLGSVRGETSLVFGAVLRIITRVGTMTVVLVVVGYFAAMTLVLWLIGMVTGGDTTAP